MLSDPLRRSQLDKEQDGQGKFFENSNSSSLIRSKARAPPIETLTVDLFLRILCEVSLSDRIRAALVSRRWRRVVLGHARLWSFVKWTGRRPDVLQAILARSLRSSLSIHVILHHPVWVDIDMLRIISAHLFHTRELRIVLWAGQCPVQRAVISKAARHVLTMPAPILERLSFRFGHSASDVALLDYRLFAGRAPRLQHLVLGAGLSFAPNCAAVVNVTHLVMTLPSVANTGLPNLGKLFPQLQSLSLSMTETVLLPGRFPFILSRLTLQFQYPTFGLGQVFHLAKYFRFAKIQHLQLSHYRDLFTDPGHLGLFRHVLRQSPRLAVSASSSLGTLSYKFISPRNQTLIVDSVPLHMRLPDTVFAAVVTCTIQEACLLESIAFLPRFPRVQALELVLVLPQRGSEETRLHVIDAFNPTKARIDCPALRALGITSHRRAERPASLSVGEILQFLDTCLNFKMSSLEGLVLHDIALLPTTKSLQQKLLRRVQELYERHRDRI